MQTLQWKKSTYSGDSSNCVEIATTPGALYIRDTKTTESPPAIFRTSAWAPFISHVISSSSSHRSTGRQPSLGA
ncbi:DUF397 domain-containing protein [Streptomyces sviceus]|uniref:DUF397 domain-containing protein n=1 Tax=Streptomyces sviceus TaxID=285530 RepID=UPI0036D0C83D